MDFDAIQPDNLTKNTLKDVSFTIGAKLTICNLEIDCTLSQVSNMSAWEFAHWIAIENWLSDYSPDVNAPNLDKIRGYLEAFHHLCELSEWEKAFKILFLDISFLGAKQVLHEQLFIWGYYQEQIIFFQRLLNRFSTKTDCFLLNRLGRAYGHLGQVESAISCYQQALIIAIKTGNYAEQAQGNGGLGRIYNLQLEEDQKAIFHYQKQLEISQLINDTSQELCAILGIANSHFGILNYHQAIKFSKPALALAQISHDVDMEIEISGFIGIVYSQMGFPKKGIPLIERQLSLSLDNCNQYQQYLALYRLAIAYTNLQKYEIGIEYFQQALKIIDILGEPVAKSRILGNLGVVYAQTEKYVLALEYLLAAFNIACTIDSKLSQIYLRINMAFCYSCLKQTGAFEHLQIAMNLAKKLKSREVLSVAVAGLANYYWHQRNHIYGLMLIIKSFWIYPPWKSSNGKMVFRSVIRVISGSIIQMMQRFSIYFRGNSK